MKAEISQSTLRWSSDDERAIFAARVLNFINPKFESEEEYAASKMILVEFAQKCELTANEFLLALELAADHKLYTAPDENGNSRKVSLFREIDRLKLGETKAAYIYHKSIDKQYENGKAEIKAFLEPPAPELTPEEKKAQRKNFLRAEYSRLKTEGRVLGTVIFYDLIKKTGIEKVNLKFVEAVLSKFQPETVKTERQTEAQRLKIPKIQKHDAKVFFIDNFVSAYFNSENLKELSEVEFVDYWEKIYYK